MMNAKGREAATEKFGPAVADFIVRVHPPNLPPPSEVVAHAVELECGHEALRLTKPVHVSRTPDQDPKGKTAGHTNIAEASGRNAINSFRAALLGIT